MSDRPGPYRVLFLCTGNSARSIIAEYLLNRAGQGKFKAHSAGSTPKGEVHPYTLDLLRRMLGGGLNGVFAQPTGPETHEVEQLGIRAVEHHVERRLRSTALL